MKKILVLGCTGSIGTNTLSIVRNMPEDFCICGLSAHKNKESLAALSDEFGCASTLTSTDGVDGIRKLIETTAPDVIVNGIAGSAGLLPSKIAAESGVTLALANKETIVMAWHLIKAAADRHGCAIIPVDSEHSAIFQALLGERQRPEKILLTASGGPFLHLTAEELQHATREQALRHPNWNMGAKVTIDSASLMNKGFEMIEAKWLFEMQPDEIEILVHPQSIIHSMVQFRDGSVKAQLGIPDMRLPISYALGITHRIPNNYPRVDFTATPLTFERPDLERFPNLSYAFDAIRLGGNAPCALNAANEIAVTAFLRDEISFTDMSRLLYEVMEKHELFREVSLPTFIETDSNTRRVAESLLPKFRR